jgi:hypothetical protein
LRGGWLILAVLPVFAIVETAAAADPSAKPPEHPIYRYVDPNGTPVFTDDLSRVPPQFRSSAKVVELPPLIKLPEPSPPPKPEPPSFSIRMRAWFQAQPWEYRLIIVGVLPVLVLSLSVLSFLRGRTENAFIKTSLRLGMLAILFLTVYLSYFILVRVQATKLIGSVPGGNEIISSPKQKAEGLKKDEADRLKKLEDIANQK